MSFLDEPIIKFNNQDYLSFRALTRGVFITGSTGSGKSSSSGALLRRSFLRLNMGGLVCCVKEDEYHEWKAEVIAAGRKKDLVVFSPDNPWRFNFLEYEATRANGGGEIYNIVNLLMNIYQMGQEQKSSKGEDRFWDSALKRLLNMAVSTIMCAGERLTIDHLYDVVSSAPDSLAEVNNEKWREESDCFYCIAKAKNEPNLSHTEEDKRLIVELERYWLKQFAGLDERTRSNIIESFYGLIDPFRRGLLRELFCTETNCPPEVVFQNKIVILNVPVTKYLQLGSYVQSVYRLMFEQSAERRTVNNNTLPVFLWIDEVQKVIQPFDSLFLTTARSSRVVTVFITQNISNLYAALGGNRPEHLTNSLLSNLSNKFFHANTEHITNQYAADIIGKTRTINRTKNYSLNVDSPNQRDKQQVGISQSINLYYQVFPVEFTTLKTGGYANEKIVECFVIVTGKTWSNGLNHYKLSLKQI